MANTPSFNWETPDDTDLVKDGAAAIRTLGNAIDSSMTDLKGGTTGQVLSKASNTDMDFTWTSETDPTAIQKTIVDAKGDLISATAADTPARLAVGTDGQVLTADSTQSTGLKWATPASALTWTTRKAPNANGEVFNVIEYNGSNLWVAAGQSGVLWTSPDAKTWTSRTSGFGTNTIYDVGYGNGLWVAVGANGTLTTSSDGVTWTARTSNMSSNAILSVIYANSTWIAVGNGGGATNTGGIIYSTDGITWTRKSQTPGVGTSYNDVIWNGTNFVVVGSVASTSNNALYASTPSGTWTAITTGVAAELDRIFWDGTRHIIVRRDSGSSYFSTSTTLGTLTQINAGTLANYTSGGPQRLQYYDGFIYAVGQTFDKVKTTLTNNYYDSSVNLGLNPYTRSAGSGTIAVGNSPLWVGASGFVLGDEYGRIATSF